MLRHVDREYANRTCPYCDAGLDPLPRAKKRCPSCRESIYVRSGPDGLTYLLQEADLPTLQAAWGEYHEQQEWVRRALAFTDDAGFTKILADLRTKDPAYSPRDAY